MSDTQSNTPVQVKSSHLGVVSVIACVWLSFNNIFSGISERIWKRQKWETTLKQCKRYQTGLTNLTSWVWRPLSDPHPAPAGLWAACPYSQHLPVLSWQSWGRWAQQPAPGSPRGKPPSDPPTGSLSPTETAGCGWDGLQWTEKGWPPSVGGW